MNLSRAGVDIAKSVFFTCMQLIDMLNPGGTRDSGVLSAWMLCVSVLPLVRRWEWRPVHRPITGDENCRSEGSA